MEVTRWTSVVAIAGLVLIGLLGAQQLAAVIQPRARWTIETVYGGSPDPTDHSTAKVNRYPRVRDRPRRRPMGRTICGLLQQIAGEGVFRLGRVQSHAIRWWRRMEAAPADIHGRSTPRSR